MPAKKFIVELDADERERLGALVSNGKAPAKTILKARILLKADRAEGGPGWLDALNVEPARPLVCFDETSMQLVAETREPEPMQPGTRPAGTSRPPTHPKIHRLLERAPRAANEVGARV